VIFGNFPDGEPTIFANKPNLWDIPQKPILIGFINKKNELIEDFLTQDDPDKLFCSINGCNGTGKSTLAKYAVNCVQDRNVFTGGIIYINARSIKGSD
jgi:predicted AAA+ superfamily ATPase